MGKKRKRTKPIPEPTPASQGSEGSQTGNLLSLLGIVLSVVLTYTSKTPASVVIFLVLAAACSIWPIIYLVGVVSRKPARQTVGYLAACFAITAAAAVWLGVAIWPSPKRHKLTARERETFSATLRSRQYKKRELQIQCPSSDEAACIYAEQFILIFEEAGWTVANNRLSRVSLARPHSGVIFVEYTPSVTDPKDWKQGSWLQFMIDFRMVAKAFQSIGVEIDLGGSHSLSVEQAILYFGSEREDESAPTEATDTLRLADQKDPIPAVSQ